MTSVAACFLAIGALTLVSGCGTGFETLTVGGAQPQAVVDSDRMATGDATIAARWQQTVVGSGPADVYLYAPGHAQGACHLTTRAAGMDFHCENHAGEIVVTGIDPAAPHTVAISLDRGGGTAALTVMQGGTAALQDRGSVSGAPDVAAGQRLRVQLQAAPGTTARIDRLEVTEVN